MRTRNFVIAGATAVAVSLGGASSASAAPTAYLLGIPITNAPVPQVVGDAAKTIRSICATVQPTVATTALAPNVCVTNTPMSPSTRETTAVLAINGASVVGVFGPALYQPNYGITATNLAVASSNAGLVP